jgi:HEAT repeat protein
MDATALAAKLNDSDPGVRAAAAEDLAHLAEGAQSAAVPLVQAMGDADEDVRNWAYAALESLGLPRPEDVPAMIKLAADPCLDVAYWAVTLLGRFGGTNVPGAAQIVGALAGALDSHAEIAVRQRAAWALGQFGAAAKAATDSLTKAAVSSDPRLVRLSKEALGNIG